MLMVNACLRDGTGGSPTAVLVDEDALSDEERRRVPVDMGTSHAVFLRVHQEEAAAEPTVDLRFFTSEGELPACGHGTVAALAFVASRTGAPRRQRATLRASKRTFDGWFVRDGANVTATFGPGPVSLREPTGAERSLMLSALGIMPQETGPGMWVAGVARERLLVPVPTRAALAALAPDLDRLREACDHLGLLGAYVYSAPSPTGRAAARMFAPSIGVPEDIANANSTACLAAHLAGNGSADIAVDMGDALGSPATITATARPGASGPVVRVGGTAYVADQ
ncbi:trans-2,3-dihydro-3-hydroxyanthranilate isomerase [Streptacidiphilus sp. EB103A]